MPPSIPSDNGDEAAPLRGEQRVDALRDGSELEPVPTVAWHRLWRDAVRERVEASERYEWIVLWTLLFGLFAVGFTITILSFSQMEISRDFGASKSTVAWVITGPILAFAVVGPSMGKLADLVGPRRVYVWSMAGAAAFSLVNAAAWDIGALVGSRVAGAVVGAAIGPSSLSIINRTFPRERRAQAMGYWSLVAAGGPVVGVVAGGPIVEEWGWRTIFAGQAPLMAAGVLVAFAILPEIAPGPRVRFDVAGAVLVAATASSALVALNRGPEWGWSSPGVIGCFVASPIFLAATVWVERRAPHPLVPLEYFRRRNFVAPIAAFTFANFAYMGGFIVTPYLLGQLLGYSTGSGSLLSIPRPLVFAIAGPIAGYLTARVGERTMGAFGMASITASMVALATVGAGSGPWVVMGALALSGIGMGSASPALAAAIANAVDDGDLGVAGAFQQMMSQVGVVAGTQVMLTVQVVRAGDGVQRTLERGVALGAAQVADLEASFHLAYLVGAAVCALAVVAALAVRDTVHPAMAGAEETGPGRDEGAPEGALVHASAEPTISR